MSGTSSCMSGTCTSTKSLLYNITIYNILVVPVSSVGTIYLYGLVYTSPIVDWYTSINWYFKFWFVKWNQ